LLIRHSKYSEYTPTDCFFGDFAYWDYLGAFIFGFLKAVSLLIPYILYKKVAFTFGAKLLLT